MFDRRAGRVDQHRLDIEQGADRTQPRRLRLVEARGARADEGGRVRGRTARRDGQRDLPRIRPHRHGRGQHAQVRSRLGQVAGGDAGVVGREDPDGPLHRPDEVVPLVLFLVSDGPARSRCRPSTSTAASRRSDREGADDDHAASKPRGTLTLTETIYEKRDRIAYITLNREHAANAFNVQMCDEMAAIWTDFRDDDETWVAIVTVGRREVLLRRGRRQGVTDPADGSHLAAGRADHGAGPQADHLCRQRHLLRRRSALPVRHRHHHRVDERGVLRLARQRRAWSPAGSRSA